MASAAHLRHAAQFCVPIAGKVIAQEPEKEKRVQTAYRLDVCSEVQMLALAFWEVMVQEECSGSKKNDENLRKSIKTVALNNFKIDDKQPINIKILFHSATGGFLLINQMSDVLIQPIIIYLSVFDCDLFITTSSEN